MAYDPERVTLFANTDARGQHTPFGIKAKDRTRHVYVIGKTGMGKSTLLENMAVQDIHNGEGLAFIDPHGQTAETLLDYVPEERVQDLLYFAPFDMEYPVSFNVMEDVGPDKRHLVVSGLMSVFEKIWVDAWSARMAYILQNTLMALLEYPDSTLLGVNRMLSDKDYRNKVVANLTDPSVRSFWVDEFAKYNERYMQEAGDAIKNKIGQFTANPLIRNIIGQPKSSFDIRKIMDEKKILIMNLSKGLVGETNANLLGSMLTTRIYLAAMSRSDLPTAQIAQMPNFYFYVDEFQSFANSTFANILSEARKYKLNLTIAHQYIEQMEEEVKNAVFGNVGTIISFRVGPFDAEVLETIFAPRFTATDIVNLGFAQIYLTLMIDGIGSPPFSAQTLPPIKHEGTSCKDMIVQASRRQFAKGRMEVEQNINEWHATPAGPSGGANTSGGSKQSTKPITTTAAAARKTHTPAAAHNQNRTHPSQPSGPRPSAPSETKREQPKPATDKPAPPKQDKPNHKPQQPSVPPEERLTELRSVLQNISSGANDNTGKSAAKTPEASAATDDASYEPPKFAVARRPQKQQQSAPSQKGTTTSAKATADTHDLKSALAAAVGSLHTEPTPPASPPAAADTVKSATTDSKPDKPAGESTAAPQSEAPEPAARNRVSGNGDPLDPKKIERMMRNPGSDRSPF